MHTSSSSRLALLTSGIVLLLLPIGCAKKKGGEFNQQLTWTQVHAERSYTDTLTRAVWTDSDLVAPAFSVTLDLLIPTAEGEMSGVADSLRSFLIRSQGLEAPEYRPEMEVKGYLEDYIALRLVDYLDDLSRVRPLLDEETESPGTLLSFFTDELTKTDSLVYNAGDLVSLRMTQYAFIGGANGTTTIGSANYDLKHNQSLEIERLFADGSEERVNAMLLEALKVKFAVDSVEALAEKGVYFYEEAKMGPNFYLTPEGVTFYFNPYDIAAHFVGPIELTLSYTDLDDCLTDEYRKRLTAQL